MIVRKELKNKAKEQIRGKLGILFLCNVAIYSIIFFLCFISIVGIVLSVVVTPVLIWSLLLFMPGIIKAIAYSMSYYIAIDETDLSAMESIKESEKIMVGYKIKYFLLLLSFIPWLLLVIITLGAVGVYVIPYFKATKANFYNVVKEEGNMFS